MGRALEYLTQPQWRAVDLYRLSDRWYRSGHETWALLASTLNRVLFGVDIEPGARIGQRFAIRHGSGIVAGRGVTIGDDCLIFHGVTLGVAAGRGPGAHMYPTVGDRVTLYAGAKVLGPITIGDDAVIGAGAVVLADVPAKHVAVGVPARTRPLEVVEALGDFESSAATRRH